MRLQLPWSGHHWDIEVPEQNLVRTERGPAAPAVTDLSAAVRQALETPFHFPALRRALTPEDHIAIAVDEHLPRLPEILVPLLEHISSAGVKPEAITLVCQPPSTGQAWALDLPDEYQVVQVEVHQPGDRRKLSYLAATKQGRRVYLNKSAVDADQLILLTGRGYDPQVGVSGAETALFPNLSDEATVREFAGKFVPLNGAADTMAIRKEAVEVAWLLGAPFLVQVIEGTGGEILHVLAGPIDSSAEGERMLDARWRVTMDRLADIVFAGISDDPARQTFEDLARAFFNASRVVKKGGRIVLQTDAKPALGRAAALMRQHRDPVAALRILLQEKPPDLLAGFLWASAAEKAKLHLASRLPDDVVKELFAIPVKDPDQVRALVGNGDAVLVLPDAHRTHAVFAITSRLEGERGALVP
jgi:nickel-dependent lactate racemase